MNMFRTILVLVLGLALVNLPGCSRAAEPGAADLAFVQTAFKALAEGDAATAEPLLDYETLNMMGMDAGKIYAAMPEAGKGPFRQSFITSFSTSFKGSGATYDALKNWRVQSTDAAKSVIAADGLKGPLYFTVSHRTGKPLLSGIGVTP